MAIALIACWPAGFLRARAAAPRLTGSSMRQARAGSGGFDGFEWFGTGTSVENVGFDWFEHSDALLRSHMEQQWFPYLRQLPSGLGLAHGRNIQDGETFQALLKHTGTVVDKDAYGNLPNYREVELPRGLSTTWIKVNPDIYTFLMDRSTGLPAGYLNAMPVNSPFIQVFAPAR